MEPTVEQLYAEIGKYIAAHISEPWERAWIHVEFAPDVISSRGRFRRPGDAAEHSFRISGKLNRQFGWLRERTRKKPGEEWKAATFNLTRDGKFHMDFEY